MASSVSLLGSISPDLDAGMRNMVTYVRYRYRMQ